MADITHGTWIKDGKPVDKVYSNGKQVYGRNLLTGTSNELKTVTRSGWGGSPISSPSGTYGAGRYYASAYIENTTPADITIAVHLNGSKWNTNVDYMQAGQSGIASGMFDIPEGQSLASVWVGFTSEQTEICTYKYKELMVTRTPSTWSPAPEDILK